MDNLTNIDINDIDFTIASQETLEFWASRYWAIEGTLRDGGFDDLAEVARAKAFKFWFAAKDKAELFK